MVYKVNSILTLMQELDYLSRWRAVGGTVKIQKASISCNGAVRNKEIK
jgi:hypothetical protein